METEIWKDIPGHLGYQASNLGRVRSPHKEVRYASRGVSMTQRFRSKVLTACWDYRGRYLKVGVDGRSIEVSRLVALAWHGLPPTPEHQAAHRNDDRTNNTPDNLYWATRLENAEDAKRNGGYKYGDDHVGRKMTDAQVVEVRDGARKLIPAKEAAKLYGVSVALIYQIRSGYCRRKARGIPT